jgi:hypothetical protein
MSNQGLYGLPQGNESRAAGRHNGAVMAQEKLDETMLVEGDVQARWQGFWQVGANASLELDVRKTREAWLASFLPGGELPNGKEITEDVWRKLVNERINSILTRATFGPPGKGARKRRV